MCRGGKLYVSISYSVDHFSRINGGPMVLEDQFLDKHIAKNFHPPDLDGPATVAVDTMLISEIFAGQVCIANY